MWKLDTYFLDKYTGSILGGQKWLLDTNYSEYGGSLLHFVLTHKQETRLSTVLTSDIPITVHISFISNYYT
jgi:hypothetical protein